MSKDGGARYLDERTAALWQEDESLAVRIMNKYIVCVHGVERVVEADRADVNHDNGILFFGLDTIHHDEVKPVCAFKEWDWWTQADKPLNIKTEDK